MEISQPSSNALYRENLDLTFNRRLSDRIRLFTALALMTAVYGFADVAHACDIIPGSPLPPEEIAAENLRLRVQLFVAMLLFLAVPFAARRIPGARDRKGYLSPVTLTSALGMIGAVVSMKYIFVLPEPFFRCMIDIDRSPSDKTISLLSLSIYYFVFGATLLGSLYLRRRRESGEG